MRLRASPVGILFFLLCLARWAPADGVASPVTRQDDAYHFASFAGGAHEGNFAEWWYFNLVDPDHGVNAVFAYSVIDPANKTQLGMASVLAVVYAAGGPVQQGAYLPPDSFAGSPEQADVSVAEGPAGGGRIEVIDDGRYRITGTVAGTHRVAWNLVYTRRSPPWLAADERRVGWLPWEVMSWLVYMPSASVSGSITVDGRRYRLRGARGYHDHNWGEWIPGLVTWNWAQYGGPGIRVAVGDFPNVAEGAVGVDFEGRRTVFEKPQYWITHSDWAFDLVNQQWFPTTSWLWAANQTTILAVRFHVQETVPIVPPLNFPIRPLVYEQTADVAGALWERTPPGDWRLLTTFADTGFKEYTSVTVASPP
jgi:hypothetical protein